MGFNECNDATPWNEIAKGVGKDERLPSPTSVNGNQLDQFRKRYVQRIGPLEHHNSRVFPQFPGQSAIGGIHGINALRSALKQAVHKPADMASQICADLALYGDAEMIQRRGQFDSSARNKGLLNWICWVRMGFHEA